MLSVIIPTIGREPGLERALRSVFLQDGAGKRLEAIVVGDSHDRRDVSLARAVCERYQGARYLDHDGGPSCYGQQQRQFGMQHATGEWLAFLADDDIWTEGAFLKIVAAVLQQSRDRPLLFRVHHWLGWPIWDERLLLPGHVDANCIVTPNEPDRLGEWGLRYEGDYDFISQTVAKYGGDLEWRSEIIGRCRPTVAEDWTQVKAKETVRA